MVSIQGPIYEAGQSLIEVLIALAIILISISSAILVLFGGQSMSLDGQTNQEALYQARALLENARASSSQDFSGISTSSSSYDIYNRVLKVTDLDPCKKLLTSRVAWQTEKIRPQRIELTTKLADRSGVLALGLDCHTDLSLFDWTNPQSLNAADFSPVGSAKANGIDMADKVAFVSAESTLASNSDLYIFDARLTTATTSPVLIASLDTGPSLNALDAIRNTDGNFYIFAAQRKTTHQFQVIKEPIDLANPPAVVAERSLIGVDPSGSFPYGYSVYYYGSRAYIATKRTAGPEFHVFDVSVPANPIEIGRRELNHNVNAIVVRDQRVNGVMKRIAYLATSGNTADLFILDVTNPAAITTLKTVDLPGSHDAQSLYLLGTRLYVGKISGSNAEHDLYILDVSHPNISVPILGSKDMASDIKSIRVSGNFAFLATSEVNKEFQVWNISDPTAITNISKFNYVQKVLALDAEDSSIYTANQNANALRIIKSP